MIAITHIMLLLVVFITSIYPYFMPTPWTEYALADRVDSYQLGLGIFSGRAFGTVPAFADDGDGGQDVVGKWSREEGLLKLSFRKFKKTNDMREKELWQYIGTGKTKSEDYHVWHDYLRYDRSKDSLVLVKRVYQDKTYLPARAGNRSLGLYPEKRIKESKGSIGPTEIFFHSR